jgi:hypothetical protein
MVKLADLEAFVVRAKSETYVGNGSRGREVILVSGVEAYAMDYCGGLIKP